MQDSSVGAGPVHALEVVVGGCGAAPKPGCEWPLVKRPSTEAVAVDHRPALQ